jgi:organic radical activating enzyme
MQAGRRAVFLRFAGCNLWTGREEDREAASCNFCDTDFVGMDGENGGRYESDALAERVALLWREGLTRAIAPGNPSWTRSPSSPEMAADCRGQSAPAQPRGGDRPVSRPLVVVTGGEPLLQLDASLIDALHARGFEIAVETNGTLPAPAGLDWICVSPKAGTEVVQRAGDELKLVWPQAGIDPDALAAWDFRHLLIQPMDCADKAAALAASVDLVMRDPRWSLSLQTHKILGLP